MEMCLKTMGFLVGFVMSMVELAGEFKGIILRKMLGFFGPMHLNA